MRTCNTDVTGSTFDPTRDTRAGMSGWDGPKELPIQPGTYIDPQGERKYMKAKPVRAGPEGWADWDYLFCKCMNETPQLGSEVMAMSSTMPGAVRMQPSTQAQLPGQGSPSIEDAYFFTSNTRELELEDQEPGTESQSNPTTRTTRATTQATRLSLGTQMTAKTYEDMNASQTFSSF